IESVFTSNGLSLFPFALSDVHSRCNCPDPKNPCKHIAAVYYQLGDFFREDPFVLFQLRGRSKAQILEALRRKRSGLSQEETTPESDTHDQSTIDSGSSAVVSSDQFWKYDEPLDSSLVVITPSGSSTILDMLGMMPLAPNEAQTIRQHLDSIYQAVGQQAMMTALSRNA
ncbi:MAG: SWIM zinc finger family protein, partial [Cyanobacteria bacterium J06626_14]